MVLSTSGGLGEAETAGVRLNVIPREGGNTFSGSFAANGANGSWQGSNYTQSLQDQGLRAPSELLNMYEFNPMGGGRIIRDKLWFYTSYRQVYTNNTVPGMFTNRNAGNPNAWGVDFDRRRSVVSRQFLDRMLSGRVTWQATPRNKINLSWQEQIIKDNWKSGGTATTTGEAFNARLMTAVAHLAGRDLVVAADEPAARGGGLGHVRGAVSQSLSEGGRHAPSALIRAQEQGAIYGIPNLTYRFPGGVGGGFNHHLIGTKANNRASLSFVTGAHNMKFGYQGGFNNPNQTYQYFNELIHVRLNNAVPNRLTQVITVDDSDARIKVTRNLWPTSFYAQDQWTKNRLTVQGGIRYDYYLIELPRVEDRRPGLHGLGAAGDRLPVAVDTVGQVGRRHAARGRRLRRVRQRQDRGQVQLRQVRAGRHRGQQRPRPEPHHPHRDQHDADVDDRNNDFVANCDLINTEKNGECGAMSNKNLGKEVFDRTYDVGFVEGFGVRPNSTELGPLGAAGSGAARVGQRRLLPQHVGELVHGGQPEERARRLDAVQHDGTGRPASAR